MKTEEVALDGGLYVSRSSGRACGNQETLRNNKSNFNKGKNQERTKNKKAGRASHEDQASQ